jgi:phosphoserine phosphatase
VNAPRDILAVVFDFDETLLPDSTTMFLASRGVDTEKFWGNDAKALVEDGFDPTLAYLQLMLDLVGKDKPLGKLSRKDLHGYGKQLNKHFYPGLPQLFKDLRKSVAQFNGIEIEFYIISSGLLDVIRGSTIVQDHFKVTYACELSENSEGCLSKIKRCVTFTEKTRYLFEINKGFSVADTHKNQYLVNKDVRELDRRIPLRNMIYIGDGLTDIPCFSLITRAGGTAFGVFHPDEEKSAKRAFLEFLKTDRVVSCHSPKYRRKDELGSLLRAAVLARCSQIDLERQGAVTTEHRSVI